MQTIIAPTDFSDISVHAVYYAADMAEYINAKLLVLHATEELFDDVGSPEAGDFAVIEDKLETLKNDLIKRSKGNLNVSAKQVSGIIENEVIKMCDYKDPLAVVMATHAADLPELFLMGSITIYLSENLKYPVIVVPVNVSFKPVKNIILANDMKHSYDLPIEKIKQVVKNFNAGLDVVHVYQDDISIVNVENNISELRPHLGDIDVKFHCLKGDDVQQEIVKYAKENNSDLIIVLPGKHAFFQKSESKKFIFHSPITVMSIQ